MRRGYEAVARSELEPLFKGYLADVRRLGVWWTRSDDAPQRSDSRSRASRSAHGRDAGADPAAHGTGRRQAQLLSPEQSAFLDALSRELQSKTGAQAAVLTVETTAPEDLFDYGLRVAQAWQLGSKAKDDGLLLVVASRDRKLRFFTGYGSRACCRTASSAASSTPTHSPCFSAASSGRASGTAMNAARARDRGRSPACSSPARRHSAAPRPSSSRSDPRWIFLLLLLGLLLLRYYGSSPGRARAALPSRVSGRRPRLRRLRRGLWRGRRLGGGGFGGGGGGFGGGGAGRGW